MSKINGQKAEVLINGTPVKTYYHEGKTYIEARNGTEYEIRVRNDSSNRTMAVCSVDGINVVTGEAAVDRGSGYVLPPSNSYTIKGFRTSNDTEQAFVFSKKNKSYAAKSDEPGVSVNNVGVIAVKFYSEVKKEPAYGYKTPRRPYTIDDYDQWPTRPWVNPWNYPYERPIWSTLNRTIGSGSYDDIKSSSKILRSKSAGPSGQSLNVNYSEQSSDTESCYFSSTEPVACASATSFDSSENCLRSFDMGTAFSDKEIESHVTTTTFDTDVEIGFVEIYYASRNFLESIGVDFKKKPAVAFPQSFSPKFCKRPTR